MRTYTKGLIGCLALALATVMAPLAAGAQTWDETTYVTFNQPVELPGVVLPAGTYIFRLPDRMTDPWVVQVLSQDRAKVYATLIGQQRTLVQPNKSPVEMFNEAAPGSPLAVRSWFLPDDMTTGVDFIYPKEEVQGIASETQSPVPSAGLKHAE
jgi:hypothetical protein